MKHKNGFTLIELIVVISIMAILSAIAVPSYIYYREKARSAKATAMGRELFSAATWSSRQRGTLLTTQNLKDDVKYFTDIDLTSSEIINGSQKILKLFYSSEGSPYMIEINVNALSYVIRNNQDGAVIDS